MFLQGLTHLNTTHRPAVASIHTCIETANISGTVVFSHFLALENRSDISQASTNLRLHGNLYPHFQHIHDWRYGSLSNVKGWIRSFSSTLHSWYLACAKGWTGAIVVRFQTSNLIHFSGWGAELIPLTDLNWPHTFNLGGKIFSGAGGEDTIG